MRLRMLVVPAVLIAVALPAQAGAHGFSGTLIAKQPQRGTLLVARPDGTALTVRGRLARARVGDRVTIQGVRLHDGTMRMSRLQVHARVRTARLRGTVLRTLVRGTLLATGRSVVVIHQARRQVESNDDHGGLEAGDVAEFRIRFDDDDLVEAAPPAQVGTAVSARIEGTIASVSPLVVVMDGLPLTITVPAGTKLPTTLAAGQRIELTVQVGEGNTFTLVAIDEVENANPAVPAQEVEVKGFVTSSTPTQLVVNVDSATFTFVAPTGTTLPQLPDGTFVELRGLRQNDTITLTRLRVEDDNDRDGRGSGSGGGGDDGGHGGSGSGGSGGGGGHH